VQKIRHYERIAIVPVVFGDSSDNVVMASSCSIVAYVSTDLESSRRTLVALAFGPQPGGVVSGRFGFSSGCDLCGLGGLANPAGPVCPWCAGAGGGARPAPVTTCVGHVIG